MNAIYELITKLEWFSGFLEILLCTYFCSAFMESSKKAKESNTVLSVVLAFILAFVANEIVLINEEKFLFNYEKKIFLLIICVIVQWIYFHRKFFLAVVVSLLYSELTMVLELVVQVLLMRVSMLSYQEEITFLIWRILAITIAVAFLHCLVPKSPIPMVYLLVVAVFTVMALLWNWAMTGADNVIFLPEELMNMSLPLMVMGFFLFQIVVIFYVLKIAETHQQKQTTALIELNNKMLQKSLDETEQTFDLWRQSVHDYKNHVIVLKQLADENRMDEIKAFLEEENDTINKQLFMIRTGNSVVDTLVNLKRSLAEKYHIAFIVHGTLPEKLVVENMDLANILGNLLDNAIEASMKEQDAYIDLTIKQEKSFLLLSMRNKCTDASAKEIDKSSKENPEFHGIGLKSVKRAVKKYDGQINVEQNEHEFVVTIMIQNKQEFTDG